MTAYPSSFPTPKISGYNYTRNNAVIRTNMTSGAARQRRRFTNVPTTLNCSIVFTRDEFAFFEAWYLYDAKEGAEWFDFPVSSGNGLSDMVETRFLRPYTLAFASSEAVQVQLTLEVRKMPVIDESIYRLLENGITVDSLEAIGNRIDHITNVDGLPQIGV